MGLGLFAMALAQGGTPAGPAPDPTAMPAATVTATARPTSEPPSRSARRIGLISGHRGNDTGTVCADGYTEAQLAYETAVRTATLLRAGGHAVDILDEFDERLSGYTGQLLLSIHADSCSPINAQATGFKAARSEDAPNPQEGDRLVACLRARYAAATLLRWNQNTITHNMTRYHALYKVDRGTVAGIIEIGFMHLDRDILQRGNAKVAEGIANGIQCYLNREPV